MKLKHNQDGVLNVLLIPLILSTVFFVSTLGFAAWAFMSRQDYKDNADQKIAAAVEVAKKQVSTEKDNEFLEKEKFPLKTFNGPADLGSLSMSYPKTWSAYISGNDEKTFIFNPDIVTERDDPVNALRITIEDTVYSEAATQYDSQVSEGKLSASVYSLPKLPEVVGVRFDGEIEDGKRGALIVLPLRDKTIKIACEIPDRIADFNNIILPNISFKP